MKRRKRVSKRGRSRRRTGITIRASAEAPSRRQRTADEILELYKPRKKPITLRLDADVLQWFRKPGRGYQTRINRALRKVMRDEMGG